MGVVFDCSGSMGSKLEKSRQAVAQFFKTANPEDEFFLVQFNDSRRAGAAVHHQPGRDSEPAHLHAVQGPDRAAGRHLPGLHEMKKAKNPRKALLVISDGGDNNSRYTEGEIKNLVKEADVQIYAIGIYEPVGGALADGGGNGRARPADGNRRADRRAAVRGGEL